MRFEETRQLLENSTFFYVIAVNMQGKYDYVNRHYNQRFSAIHGSILNQRYEVTMHADDTRICEVVAKKCFENTNEVFAATIRKHDGKGGYIITQWEYRAMLDEDNKPCGIFCVGYDITQFVLQQGELTVAHSTIEKTNGVLQQIAFTQSHLIRMPLTNVLALAEILMKENTDESVKNVITMLNESALLLDKRIKEIVHSTNTNQASLQ